ncbi:MAG: hypothetical protein WCK86_22420 [Planctomycetia bacterium]|jgi:hypothetical protein
MKTRAILTCLFVLSIVIPVSWILIRQRRETVARFDKELPNPSQLSDEIDYFSPDFDHTEHVNAVIRIRDR